MSRYRRCEVNLGIGESLSHTRILNWRLQPGSLNIPLYSRKRGLDIESRRAASTSDRTKRPLCLPYIAVGNIKYLSTPHVADRLNTNDLSPAHLSPIDRPVQPCSWRLTLHLRDGPWQQVHGRSNPNLGSLHSDIERRWQEVMRKGPFPRYVSKEDFHFP